MYPTLYEINTRPWIKQFGHNTTLSQIPDQYWKDLKTQGVDYVWLMGVWQTSSSSIKKYCFHPDLVKAYDNVSDRWTTSDITGSPYAIEDYIVSELLGNREDLKFIKRQLNRSGLKLILDFIPNHFNTDSHLLITDPEIFLGVEESKFEQSPYTFFRNESGYFAHGKDPYFAAWTDTVQINYFNPIAHEFMQKRLIQVSELCDGVRCDMAMLVLPEVFEKTWGYVTSKTRRIDFWPEAISKVRAHKKNFLFLAEAYWDTEWQLQQMGFDFTYDKRALDLIKQGNIDGLKSHLKATLDYQNKSIRFIENHDEERSITSLGDMKSRAAAVLFTCLPGMRLHFDGQWEGKRVHYPVQIGSFFPSAPCPCTIRTILPEKCECACIKVHYDRLLEVTKDPVFKKGKWQLIDPTEEAGDCIIFQWTYKSQEKLVAINLGNQISQIKMKTPASMKTGVIADVLNLIEEPLYLKRRDNHLYLTLPALRACIFSA